MILGTGCDIDPDIPDDVTVDGDNDESSGADDETPPMAAEALTSCKWLGADRTCGGDRKGVQFCAWLYNEKTDRVSTFWGACIDKPECSLWSCREQDAALCDLVDGRPQWMPNACTW